MPNLKCKMCGAELRIEDYDENTLLVTCEYCGTKQTVPSVDNEKKINLFNRAIRLLSACEFDKASGVYESIITDFPEEAEAYWGLVLCKYGIEYVDDPKTAKKIPTCHRSSFDSVMNDQNFDLACENANVLCRAQYREEAKQIEELRKRIIEVSSKEDPYEIFICYKETDEKGNRTVDSVIAQDVYNELTEKGYRVFFARITLEDKLGVEYEPYIFAALNSAKIMLAFGTDYEYYNAVWVKNEWSRFLQLIARGEKKVLIPCYKGIDAYDIPKEFAKLQAQDMGKVGAMQDLLRGIEKILPKKKDELIPVQQTAATTLSNIEPLLKRANMFLEDGEWKKADDFCEKVLNQDPENVSAYIVKLLASVHTSKQEDLASLATPFDNNNSYKKIIRFADKKTAEVFIKYNEIIRERNENSRLIEQKKKEDSAKIIFPEACELINNAHTPDECRQASEMLKNTGISVYSKESTELDKLVNQKIAYLLAEKRKLLKPAERLLDAQMDRTVGLRTDGTVFTMGTGFAEYGQNNVKYWNNIIEIAATRDHTVGLRSDKTVVAVGRNYDGECNVNSWKNIKSIKANGHHTVGLCLDGTVVATGENNKGQCNVSNWRNIAALYTDEYHTVGLHSDGTVSVTGANDYGECDLGDWKNIVCINVSKYAILGLTAEGTVKIAGKNKTEWSEVENWKNIVKVINCGERFAVGLRSDGKAITTEKDNGWQKENHIVYGDSIKTTGWKDVVDIVADYTKFYGLRYDGTIVPSDPLFKIGLQKNYNENEWKNLVALFSNDCDCMFGVSSDGKVVSFGNNKYGNCSTFGLNKLFDNFEDIDKQFEKLRAEGERKKIEKQKIEAERRDRRYRGVCQHCGGAFKGMFGKKCSNCGIPKDY